jgi:ribulose-5-phosphate 4-epimerase/fuculose-1-phosphate aldolase
MTLAARGLEPTADTIYQSRVDLAAAHRLANRFGFDDGIHNHFTLIVPATTDQFLVKAHGLLMSEITANNLIVVDTEGSVIEGSGTIERSAFCIHAAIHMQHPSAKCVLHAHPPYSTWLADVEDGRLCMTNQDIIRFHERVAYDRGYEGADNEVGAQFASAMGDKSILVSRNHGVTVVGTTVAEAFYDLYYMELACKRQYLLATSGCNASVVPEKISAGTRRLIDSEFAISATLYFDALKRELDREDPGYTT